MLTFDIKQIATLSDLQRQSFIERAIDYIKSVTNRSQEHGDQNSREKVVVALIDRSASYGISREIDVIRFIDLLLWIGVDFEKNPRFAWVIDYLNEPVRAEYRLDCICERLRFGETLEAR